MPDLLRESGSRLGSRPVLRGLESRRGRRSYSALNGAQSGLEPAFPRDDRISPTDSWKSGPAPHQVVEKPTTTARRGAPMWRV